MRELDPDALTLEVALMLSTFFEMGGVAVHDGNVYVALGLSW